MAAITIETPPICEPVKLELIKLALRVTISADDELIAGYIQSARLACESFTRRKFINTGLCQFLDSFPYFTDTIMSQMAYPPAYYSLPRYSTTLWNYSQMIKLFYSRLRGVPTIRYVSSKDGGWNELTGTVDVADTTKDFLCDVNSEPPRIFPKAGQFWPSVLYVPNAVEIHHIAGYNDEAAIEEAVDAFAGNSPVPSEVDVAAYEVTLRQADVPQTIKTAIMQMVAGWYENRESVAPQELREVPWGLQNLLWHERVEDLQPTRG
jgi:hypothetical protein